MPVLGRGHTFQALQRRRTSPSPTPAARGALTVLARDEKYKAKNVIDIVAVRGADAVAAGS